jgi:hypothetical protein
MKEKIININEMSLKQLKEYMKELKIAWKNEFKASERFDLEQEIIMVSARIENLTF